MHIIYLFSITYDNANQRFNTKSPTWFDTIGNNSLAYWIIFFLEISLWVHYQAYVRGQFKTTASESPLNRNVFITKDKQYVNLKNELGPYWQGITRGEDKDT